MAKVQSPVLEEPYKAPLMPKGSIQGGAKVKASDFKGKWLVLYFYPKDLTPGCTTEAADFQKELPQFSRLGALVVGCSRDSTEQHLRFAEKLGLTFPLLSDAEGTFCEEWGVWKEKKLYGKTFMGIERSTFLIDPSGSVVAEWRKVKVAAHAQHVLSLLKSVMEP